MIVIGHWGYTNQKPITIMENEAEKGMRGRAMDRSRNRETAH
jgi:hypothetical protein